MLTVTLAFHSLRNRLLTTTLTVASIALSVTLLVGVENVRAGVRESFAGTIRGTDLIVGARGGSLQILLSSVFGIGLPAGSIAMPTYERWSRHRAVAWTIPIALGDSHRGFRVIGTNESFYEHFRFRRDGRVTFASGAPAATERDVVLGADAAARLGYQPGDSIVVTHGLAGVGASEHETTPFVVKGILARTFTPIDRALYVTLDGIEHMHEGYGPGAPPPQGRVISAFFVGARNRMDALNVQREVNTDLREPLTAVIPGIALAELWQGVGNAEAGLKVVAGFTVLIGLIGMLVALYSSLEARRREMAILRAVGAGPRRIVSLLVLESGLLSTLGSVLGIGLVYLTLILAQGPVEQRFGLYVPIRALGQTEWMYVGIIVAAGFLVGFVPAFKAYRTSLLDGLAPRV